MKRLLEINEDLDFSLLGVCSHVKDYRLCWELNKALDIGLAKMESAADAGNTTAISNCCIFSDDENHRLYHLIPNKQNDKLLVPENDRIDYFIKISGHDHTSLTGKWKAAIQKIDVVLTVVVIDPANLKSAHSLTTQ